MDRRKILEVFYLHTLDQRMIDDGPGGRQRVYVDSDLANQRVVITVDPRRSMLAVFTEYQWGLAESQIRRLSDSDPEARRFKRVMIGSAIDTHCDPQGAVALPRWLLDAVRTGLAPEPQDRRQAPAEA